MADMTNKRPFDGFKIAITDPNYFVGRADLLDKFRQAPLEVHMLLGGGRLGKTSTLRAIEWSLLDSDAEVQSRAFPVYVNLHKVQPKDSDNLRYILISSLSEAIVKWHRSPLMGLRKRYLRFLNEIVEAEVALGFLKLKILNPDGARQFDQGYFEEGLTRAIAHLADDGFE